MRTEAGGQSQPRETPTWRTGCSIWVIVPVNKHMDSVLERRDTKCVKTGIDFNYLEREESAKKLLICTPLSLSLRKADNLSTINANMVSKVNLPTQKHSRS